MRIAGKRKIAVSKHNMLSKLKMKSVLLFLVLSLGAYAQAPRPCVPVLPETVRAGLEAKLAEARASYDRAPRNADNIIWLGRRTAYLNRFDEAIAIYTNGIKLFPKDARFYRHRGHRYLSLRRFKEAIADFEKAAKLVKGHPDETEPDGLPNARNIPTSTLNSNIYYHLGLAYYVTGDFPKALRAYRECVKFSTNPDMLAATTHWLYMTLRRLERQAEAEKILAPITESLNIIENRDYYRLLLMYQGKVKPEELLAEAEKSDSALSFPSAGYGIGNWYWYNGQHLKAAAVWSKIVTGPQCTSFGYIAAEQELQTIKY
jgi:tetratricopeptide (TPR) repeat protein